MLRPARGLPKGIAALIFPVDPRCAHPHERDTRALKR
jgi:methylglyoxal synthase